MCPTFVRSPQSARGREGLLLRAAVPSCTPASSRTRSKLATLWGVTLLVFTTFLATPQVRAQIPTVLTDKIYQGSGTIDLLRDVSGADLKQYLNANGGLLLGVDINENESGNESRDSLGLAIKQLQLVITTAAGTITFSDFYTSTTASIREAGTDSAQQFYTAFGKSGSSQITGSTTSFDLGRLDDVIRIGNVDIQGDILGATLNVTFLNTAKTTTQGNETFFDFSGGFEDFALLGRQDAAVLEAANFGTGAAPSGITYTQTSPTITLNEASVPLPPGAPAPPLILLLVLGLAAGCHFRSKTHEAR